MNFVYDLVDLSREPSRTLSFLDPASSRRPPVLSSFLSFLLVKTSGRSAAKIRAYVNVRNLVLVKLRICTCLFARQCFRLRMEEDFKLKYALSRIILACWKINPIRKLRDVIIISIR